MKEFDYSDSNIKNTIKNNYFDRNQYIGILYDVILQY